MMSTLLVADYIYHVQAHMHVRKHATMQDRYSVKCKAATLCCALNEEWQCCFY